MADPTGFDRPLSRAARPKGRDSTAACLDAETLAAWTDGTLLPSERAAAETHAADCGRCLELVAAMARTEPPTAVPARAPWRSLRWLVPLTSAAVAITAWVIVREPGTIPAPPLPEATLAPAPPPSSAALPPSEVAKQDAPDPRRERDQRQEARERKDAPGVSTPLADNAVPKRSADTLARETTKPQPAPAPAPPAAAATPSFRAEAAPEASAQLQARANAASLIVRSPDPAIQWRLSGRSIERTSDGGQSWSTQATASSDLLAGACPAPTTCWIVGRAGVVLRSTDGQTWQTISFPAATDLVTVTASDLLSAVVTTSDGRTYRTSDGGRTWPLQESPAAPF